MGSIKREIVVPDGPFDASFIISAVDKKANAGREVCMSFVLAKGVPETRDNRAHNDHYFIYWILH